MSLLKRMSFKKLIKLGATSFEIKPYNTRFEIQICIWHDKIKKTKTTKRQTVYNTQNRKLRSPPCTRLDLRGYGRKTDHVPHNTRTIILFMSVQT